MLGHLVLVQSFQFNNLQPDDMEILSQKTVTVQITTTEAGETLKTYVESENGSLTEVQVSFDLKVVNEGDPESEERTVYIDGVSDEVVQKELNLIQESLLS